MTVTLFDYRGAALSILLALMAAGCATDSASVQQTDETTGETEAVPAETETTDVGDDAPAAPETPVAEVIPLDAPAEDAAIPDDAPPPPPAAAATEGSPPDIADLAREISNHPRALWQSSSSSYEFFIGGLLNAEYSPDSKTLTLTSDRAEQQNLTCRYRFDNSLEVDGPADIDDPERTCGELTRQLATTLDR